MRLSWFFILILLTGCATLPEDYSKVTSDKAFLKGVVSNNMPLLRTATYIENRGPNGITSTATTYNDIGGYGARVGIDPIDGFTKLCDARGGLIKLNENMGNHKITACYGESIDFIVIVYYGVEPAGSDTGHAYASMHYVSLYDFENKLLDKHIKWIVDDYISFIENTIDKVYTINDYTINTRELKRLLESI